MNGITVVGLGPAGIESTPSASVDRLLTAERVIVRTEHHPAATELAALRPVEFCDDLYESSATLEETYEAIVDRVATAAPVTYAVPGSPLVGEATVRLLRERGLELEVVLAPSFLDLAAERVGLDPLYRGLQVLDAHQLPGTLDLGLPTVVAQIDSHGTLSAVKTALDKILEADFQLIVLTDLGAESEKVEAVALGELGLVTPGSRVTLVLPDGAPVGWPGLVDVTRRLRAECPWDARQTHHSLVRHLVEESHELVEAISRLSAEAPSGPIDAPAYVEVEEELGDMLLQVVFHSNLAAEAGAFDIDEVAETLRRKLVRRHPHVFGDVSVADAGEVEVNWERLKQAEKERSSLMDDVPASLPALARAAKLQRRAASVGFDWQQAEPVLGKLREEVEELERAAGGVELAHELGDVLFTVVNLARHLNLDPETALRQAADRFADRFRRMEAAGTLDGLSPEELEDRWRAAKG